MGPAHGRPYAARMKDQILWRLAAFGLTLGLVLTLAGSLAAGDLAPLARGYGLLTVLAAVYLAAGLAIRARIARRSPAGAGLRRTGSASQSSSPPA